MTTHVDVDEYRAAHGDRRLLADIAAGAYRPEEFAAISLNELTLQVDTSEGYRPGTAEIAAFARAGQRRNRGTRADVSGP
ncbi:hypothetical protein [Streptomyces wuyuanensis]|uniref:hypothetical protein n=1 Tax=Streptomyces wuyuanensis TaxID=1196353 RepID=UPI003D749924